MHSPLVKLTLISTAFVMVGCAQLKDVPSGTPLFEVEKQFGAPTTVCEANEVPNGESLRAVWSQQPYGHFAWATTVDQAGSVDGFEQVLTDESFKKLGEGVWTPDRVLCEFGPPEDITKVGLPSQLKIVWSYRYRQYGVWYSLMYVFFGTDGKAVTEFFAGPDPMYDRDQYFWWR